MFAPLVALGTGPLVEAMVLGLFAALSVIVAMFVVAGWLLVLWATSRRRLSLANVLSALAGAAVAGPLYMLAYGERFPWFWMFPVIIGSFTVANAIVISSLLVRGDVESKDDAKPARLSLRTLLLLVGVVSGVLGSLAPAFTH